MREVKDFKFSLVGEPSEEGKFAGYASVFNGVDSYNDTVLPGAFRKTLKEAKSFPLLWTHDVYQPLGILTGEEDEKGLLIQGDLNMEVAAAREKRALMKQGAVRGLSIGYEAVKWAFDKDAQIRQLQEIKLWETSLVVFPADRAARVANVKGIPYHDFGGLLDLLNELDFKDIDPRFQEAAQKTADRIYALLGKTEPPPSTPPAPQPQPAAQPDFGPLIAAVSQLNQTLTQGGN